MAKLKKTSKVRITAVVIILAAVFLAFFNFPTVLGTNNAASDFFSQLPYHLGLDLQGGTHLVYEADVSKIESGEKSDSVEGVRDVIERRVNAFGVAEPVVQINKAKGKWRIIVELAGVKDVREAIKMIGETPLLEFKEENNEPARELTDEEKKDLKEFNDTAKEKANKALMAALSDQTFAGVVTEYTENEVAAETGGDLGWIRNSGSYNFLFSKAEKTELGTVYKELVEYSDGFHILKVIDKRETDKEIKANHILICYQGAERCEETTTKEEALAKINELKAEVTPENFVQLAKENSTEPGATDTGGDLDWFGRGMMVPEFEEASFAMEKGAISDVVETDFGYHLIYKEDERPVVEYQVAEIFIKTKKESDILPPKDPWKDTGLTGTQLKLATVQFDPNTSIPSVGLEFDAEGKDLFADITTRNVDKPVAIFLDGEAISVPRVNEPIKDGQAVITGDFDVQEAKLLAQRLNAGALPVPINLVSQQTVGASLGADSLQKSLFAGLIGLALVILFMLFYYRLPGLLAVVALIIYGIIILFIFKAIPVTLTLAGIAGVILSVGMAVDANVLIFERLKEELRMGKPLGAAIEEGFKRAWSSIRDGNVSTLITCLILAWFGSSMIKGFAITLAIGVIVSMFSAVVITRQFLYLTVSSKKERKTWWFGVKKKSNE